MHASTLCAACAHSGRRACCPLNPRPRRTFSSFLSGSMLSPHVKVQVWPLQQAERNPCHKWQLLLNGAEHHPQHARHLQSGRQPFTKAKRGVACDTRRALTQAGGASRHHVSSSQTTDKFILQASYHTSSYLAGADRHRRPGDAGQLHHHVRLPRPADLQVKHCGRAADTRSLCDKQFGAASQIAHPQRCSTAEWLGGGPDVK